MLYFVTDRPTITADPHDPIQVYCATTDHATAVKYLEDTFVIDRWSIKTEAQAIELAAACNHTADKGGDPYEWTDAGSHVSPRYDVVYAPQMGAAVSYGFNGDYYPCGEIVSISAFHAVGKISRRRIVAREANGAEHVFFRRGHSGSWRKDRTWSLVMGHRSDKNPSF